MGIMLGNVMRSHLLLGVEVASVLDNDVLACLWPMGWNFLEYERSVLNHCDVCVYEFCW